MGRDLNTGPSEYKIVLISQVIKSSQSVSQSINQSINQPVNQWITVFDSTVSLFEIQLILTTVIDF